MSEHLVLTSEPLDEASAVGCLTTNGAGAIATFVGRVRGTSRGRENLHAHQYGDERQLGPGELKSRYDALPQAPAPQESG